MSLSDFNTTKTQEDETKIRMYNGRIIAKNTSYNLIGYFLPLMFAVVLIPPLINNLGEERFGILSIAWVVIGYFSFFDFGIGRTLTKLIAEKLGSHKTDEIPDIFWTSLLLMLIASLVGVVVLIILIPSLINNFFKISSELKPETINTFYALALAIPLIATTAGLRGVLEAYQKFGIINIVRIILGVFTFAGPIICMFFTKNLFWIIIFLIFVRTIIWTQYLLFCFKTNPGIRNKIKFNPSLIKPILKIGGWITFVNIIGPFILYADRFLIGIFITVSAVTYYATPYEVVTKLLLIPGALVGVLFPLFSASYVNNPDFMKKIFIRGVKFIFLMLYPVTLITVTFSHEGISLWLGNNFAEKSTLVLQLLAIGVLLNGLAYIPFNFFQGIGKPHIPALANLIELPFYLLFLSLVIKQWGINGVALIWVLRILVDTLILFYLTNKIISFRHNSSFKIVMFIFMTAALIIPFGLTDIVMKICFNIIVLFIYSSAGWKYFLTNEEKVFLASQLKINYRK